MSSVLGRKHATEPSKTIKYTPCVKTDVADEYELESVVSFQDEKTPANSNSCGHHGNGHNDVQLDTASIQSAAINTVDEYEHGVPFSTISASQTAPSDTAANGPRIFTTPSLGYHGVSDRDQLIGETVKPFSRVGVSTSTSRVLESRTPAHISSRSTSKQSIMGIVRDRVNVSGGRKKFTCLFKRGCCIC